MKRYKRFMDGVRASGTLNQRLKELKTPKKQPAAWAKYGAAAAAFILVFGGAALGMHWEARWSGRLDELFRQASYVPENVDAPQPGIAIVEPGETGQPGEKILEGYAVEEERAGVPVVHYYCLPYIEYGDTGGGEACADWDIPKGATRRDLDQSDLMALLGGEDAVNTHLDWDGYELTGWGAWYEDGSFWGAYVMGYAGPLDHFEFAVTADQLPPTCIVHENSVTQDIRGLTVTADKYDGEHGCDRRASFMKDGYGYRFDLSSTDMEQAERLVSRLVCCVADERLALWSVDPSVETYTCPDCGQTFPVDRVRAHIHSFTGGDDGASSAEPYDPNEAAAPRYNAPAVSAEPGYACPTCGEMIPAGMSHDCAMCDGYPLPHICEICGEAYPEGTAHSHEVCGLPLAPDTHACEVCGQTLPVGMEHSHQEDHHQEDHHGSHH